jgi:hypothetical protein
MQQNYAALTAVIVGLIIAALALWLVLRNRRRKHLSSRFGPEYDHTVAELGKGRAERELEARTKRVEKLTIHPLPAAERDRFLDLWRRAQALFVDSPLTAVAEADRLIGEVMRARGYPVSDFERRAADVSVDHPRVVANYREAHAIALNADKGQAGTEELRQAMVHYRALFEELLEAHEREPEPAVAH